MTNTALTNYDELSHEELLALTGQSDGKSIANYGPFGNLQINRLDEDDNGNALPKGTYMVYVVDQKEMLYGKVAKFRPFIQTFQYRVYDTDKFTNRSILFKSFNDEKFDELGGLGCGKVNKKVFETLTDDEKIKQKQIKCRRILFGLLSMEGTFKSKVGESTVRGGNVSALPVMWATSGASFMPVGDVIKALTEKNKLMFNYELELKTKREKTGSNVYYTADVSVDASAKALALSKDDLALMRQFQDYINTENNTVVEKWHKAHVKGGKDKRAAKDIDLVAELSAPKDDMDMGLGNILSGG